MNLHKPLIFVLAVAAAAYAGGRESSRTENICPLHHVRMTAVSLPIRYGKPRLDLKYEKAKDAFFPKANEGYVLGGCVVGPDSPKKETVFVCDRCTSARAEWLGAHKE